jgi:hypothetical protein
MACIFPPLSLIASCVTAIGRQPILAMKNRREANQCVRRATQLLAEMEARERNKTAGGAPDETSGHDDTEP